MFQVGIGVQVETERSDVLVIGAGMAGITCARSLSAAGQSVLVLDKGRGIGGRVATRRVALGEDEVSFDHGAQYIHARDADFAAVLDKAGAAIWDDGAQTRPLVGRPGMSALARDMAQGLDIRHACEVTALERVRDEWHVTTQSGVFRAARVIVTIPAPQVAGLLGPDHPLVAALGEVRMAPCLTLMAAFAPESLRPFVHRLDEGHPLAWIAQNSTKPGRSAAPTAWVAQAGADWSARHLERAPDHIAALMLPLLCDVIGADQQAVRHVSAHRWRYARVTQPLGQPFLCSADRSLYLGGDWCLGGKVEDAWASGRALAQDILARADVG